MCVPDIYRVIIYRYNNITRKWVFFFCQDLLPILHFSTINRIYSQNLKTHCIFSHDVSVLFPIKQSLGIQLLYSILLYIGSSSVIIIIIRIDVVIVLSVWIGGLMCIIYSHKNYRKLVSRFHRLFRVEETISSKMHKYCARIIVSYNIWTISFVRLGRVSEHRKSSNTYILYV